MASADRPRDSVADAIAVQAATLVRDSSAEELVAAEAKQAARQLPLAVASPWAARRGSQPGAASALVTAPAVGEKKPACGGWARPTGARATITPATALRNGRAQHGVEQATATSDALRLHGVFPDGSPCSPASLASVLGSSVPARDVELMLREMDTTLSDVRSRHMVFMAGGGALTPGGRVGALGAAAGQGAEKAASPDAGGRGPSRPHPSVPRRGRQSMAQQHAEDMFQDIDQGRANRQDVFMSIPSAARRIRSRADFFRTRENLVLPPIEESFMMQEKGSTIVNIAKLRSRARHQAREDLTGQETEPPSPGSPDSGGQSPRTPRLTAAPKAEGGSEEQVAAAAAAAPMPPVLSAQPSMITLSQSASMESLAQRIERLAFQAQVRDQRIQNVRDVGRQQDFNQRLAFLDHFQSKQARKEVSDRLRVIMPWLVLAMVMEWSSRVVSSFAATYSAARGGERFVLVVHPLNYWKAALRQRSAADTAAGPLLQGLAALPSKTGHLLAEALRRKNEAEVLVIRRDIAWKSWRRLLLMTRFLAMVLRLRRLNHQAELIKAFIEASYRGYTIRSSVKIYIYKVLFVQQILRNALTVRRHIRYYIIRPTVWEVETLILAPVCGIPEVTIRQAIDQHRRDWDLRSRMQEVRVLSQACRGDSISSARQAALAGTSKKIFRQQPTAAGAATASSAKSPHAAHSRNPGAQADAAAATAALSATPRGNLRRTKTQNSGGKSGRQPEAHQRATIDAVRNTTRRGTAWLPRIAEARRQPDVLPHMDDYGRASAPHLPKASQVPGTVDVLDKYRLSAETRRELEVQILKENVDQWLVRFQEYKSGLKRFGQEWRRWRLETASLGNRRRDEWPMFPQIPYYPCQLAKVDPSALHATVYTLLRRTAAGKAL